MVLHKIPNPQITKHLLELYVDMKRKLTKTYKYHSDLEENREGDEFQRA